MGTSQKSKDIVGAHEGDRQRARHWVRSVVLILVVAALLALALSTVAVARLDTPTRFEQSDWRMQYSPSWPTSSYYLYSGGTEKYTYAHDGVVYIPFLGTRLDWIAKTGSLLGNALVSIDGGAPVTVDLYSAATVYKKDVWSTGELAYGLHWVSITRAGTKNPASSGTAIVIDAVDVMGTLVWPTRYQESALLIHFSGGWTTSWCSSYSGGMAKRHSGVASMPAVSAAPLETIAYLDEATGIKFVGAKLNLVATKARSYGKMWVSVDGGPRTLVDLYSYFTKYKQTVYSTGFLVPGVHTVTIAPSGLKRPYSYGYSVNVDAFDVIAGLIEPQ
jgi:hypothetical protein